MTKRSFPVLPVEIQRNSEIKNAVFDYCMIPGLGDNVDKVMFLGPLEKEIKLLRQGFHKNM